MSVLLWAAQAALAGPITYCVGGYNTCEDERSNHVKWHFHNWVVRTADSTCFACYDEDDNTCTSAFLATHTDFHAGPVEGCGGSPNAPLFSNVVAGVEQLVIPPEPVVPPAPTPVSFTPRIDRVSPGPYTAGDEVTVYASLPDGAGGNVALRSGTVVVTAGGKTGRFSALAGPSGEVVVKFTLPPDASSATLTFEPEPLGLQAHESLSSTASASRTLNVETCRYRVRIQSPTPGASLPVGEPAPLVPELLEADGKTMAKASKLDLTWTVVPAGSAPIELKSAADGTASWTPPADLSNQGVSIGLGGRADGFSACPVREAKVTVSELGLGWETSKLPTVCTLDRVCQGTATLILPSSPGQRARVEALLDEPGTRLELRMNGQATPVTITPDHTYSFQTTPDRVENLAWSIAVIGARGELLVPAHQVEVRPGLTLELDEVIDFGVVQAGTPWDEVCKPLDYSRSTSLDGHGFELVLEGAADCASEPVLMYRNGWGQVDRASLAGPVKTGAHDLVRPIHDLCLVTSGCANELAPDGVRLRVTALDPTFADQTRTVKLVWDVQGRSWFACWGWMLVPFAVILACMAVIYGWIKPHRFPAQAAVRVASKVGDLKRNAAVTLRDLPGSGSGWYRDARIGLFSSGELRRDLRGAAVILRAQGNNVVLEAQGPLEVRNRRTGNFEPVVGVQAAIPGAIYRAGAVHFKVEA